MVYVKVIIRKSHISLFCRQQTRGFKTKSSIEAQSKRNPTLLSRFQDTFRTNTPHDIENNETLNKLLFKNEPATSAALDGDQNQLKKIYFAEGYLAAKQGDKGEKGSKFKKIFFEVLLLSSLLLAGIVFLMASNGSLVR